MKMRTTHFLLVWLIWIAAAETLAQPPLFDPNQAGPRPMPPARPDRPRLDQPGPWDRDVIVYRVAPQGKVERAAVFERAGVPTIARMKDGRLIAAHQHFPENNPADFDKVAVRFSSDEGQSWTGPKVIQLTGLPAGMRFPFDPTVVALPDGRVRLYFTSTRGRTFESGPPAIYSAISDDGVQYTVEPGVRFWIEGRIVIDCAAVLHKGLFHLFVPDNGPVRPVGERPGKDDRPEPPREGVGYHAISRDGLQFTRDDDVRVEGRRRWLGNAQSDGERITFYGTGEGTNAGPGQPRGGLWMATSEDGKTWKLVANPAIQGGDPGAVTAGDGSLIVVITGEPRPGTASARQMRPPKQPPTQPFMPPPEQPGAPARRRPFMPPDQPGMPPQRQGRGERRDSIRAEFYKSTYRVAVGQTKGWFVTGQSADLMLSGIDFNNTGGPLLFNHPCGLSSDGKRLLVADRFNNRILVWNNLPTANTPPDLVLGQKNFITNDPGQGKGELNWPGNVTISPDGKKVAVADRVYRLTPVQG